MLWVTFLPYYTVVSTLKSDLVTERRPSFICRDNLVTVHKNVKDGGFKLPQGIFRDSLEVVYLVWGVSLRIVDFSASLHIGKSETHIGKWLKSFSKLVWGWWLIQNSKFRVIPIDSIGIEECRRTVISTSEFLRPENTTFLVLFIFSWLRGLR